MIAEDDNKRDEMEWEGTLRQLLTLHERTIVYYYF